ncbi:MAG: S9 family peptidase [Acidobacteriota bacterium]|nr:S9 family peptidase [Acidobacteriota bacterium]
MKTISNLLSIFVIITAVAAFAFAQPPALIDREIFFGNPEIAGAQISPDGKYIAFIKPYKDTRNIWVKKTDEPFANAKLITNRTDRPIPGFFWSQDGKYILFTQDKGGDENFNVYAVNPAETVAKDLEVPTARNLTDAKGVRAFIYGVPESDPDTIYVGLNERDKAWHDVYKVKVSTGERTLVTENKDRLQGVIFDNADKMRLAIRSPQSGDTEILLLDGEKPRVIYSCNVFEECSAIRFHKDNKRVYIETNKGNPDLSQLVLLDVATGKEEIVESDPMKKVDFGGAAFSEVSDELIATTYNDDRVRYYFKNKDFEADYKFVQAKLLNTDISFNSSTKDENLWLISASSDTEPGEVYLFDRKNKKLTKQYSIREKLSRESLAPMTAVRYKSSDGLEIPAFLTLPKGVPAKNLPVVINPHGGPWARSGWGYNSYAQFLANRGYAVLQPNFRASTGYGKKFLNAGNNEWGQKMQDDITWGVKYLVDQGIADPKRVGIMGGSYGGYATLAGVTFTPDLYAAGVAIVAPSSLVTLLETIPPYWEAGRIVFAKRMGDAKTTEGKAQLVRQSPLTSANKIKTPLLVVQGANDPRVNKRESDQIVIALRDRNYPVEYLVAPDEGHGFARPVNNMAMIATAEKFLAKHLGGRFQSTMTPEVAKRLAEISVDPKTVTLVKAVDMSAAPAVNVAGKWKVTADVGGQSVDVLLDLKQEGAGFSGTMSSEPGNGTVQNGKVSGNMFTGIINAEIQGQQMEIRMDGKIDGGNMSGTMSGQGLPPISFTAKKGN